MKLSNPEKLILVMLSDIHEKLEIKKYDPVVRKHVTYKETKLK